MGGGGSKPIEDAFCEDGQSIISEIKKIEVYICIIFIILLIISIHFLHRRR
jgi:hypothetical protein